MPIIEEGGAARAYRNENPATSSRTTFVRTVLDSLYARHITLAKAAAIWITEDQGLAPVGALLCGCLMRRP